MTDEKTFQRAKDLLDNFSRIDDDTQNKLLNGVKCMATLYKLANVKDDDRADKSIQSAAV